MIEQRFRMLAGLGNPGTRYENTRHNVGFMVVDRFIARGDCETAQARFNGVFRQCRTNAAKLVVLKPMTFMNLSGQSVTQAMRWFRIDTEDLLVIYDDLDLPFGEVRIRKKGSAAGHNGLGSIIELTGNDEVPRLRVGIGRPSVGTSRSYVLSRFNVSEESSLPAVLDHAVDAARCWIEHGILEAMNRFNGVNVLRDPE